MTVGEVYRYIDSRAPFSLQDSFDNSGLLVGSMTAAVTRIAVCLDITVKTAEEAAMRRADLIISHHPVIFHKLLKGHGPVPVDHTACI